MSTSTSSHKQHDTINATAGQEDSPCQIFTVYSLSTAVYYQPIPQPTPVHTYIVPDGPPPSLQTPSPSILQKRNPWPDGSSSDSSTKQIKARPQWPTSYAWKDVFAVPHVTSVGNCPTPTSSPRLITLPTATDSPATDQALHAAHKVNIHLAILVGGLAVGIVVITILTVGAGCIICARRRRNKARAGNQLSDVDDTQTCQSNNTAGSSPTTMSERRLKCQTGWQMKEFSHQGILSPFSPGATSPSSCDKVEILARSGTTSTTCQDRVTEWANPVHPVLIYSHHPESPSDTCSTDAPSYFPGDDIRYTMPQCSTSALTEVSCTATIDSNSNSVCPNRLNPLTSQPAEPSTSPTGTTNLNSLFKHKAFLASMTSPRSAALESLHPPHLSPPDPAVTFNSRPLSFQSFADSVCSDSTHESMYWINRPKS
ncbi:hypothetical protein VP01_11g2 [Puccinia sorghi]|uniref:Uncharacterized protein n=1 Tax=Puccinia sorghi TaxID=27349 RepID=A0A0L6VQL7_9BASI|nr:hypothetical protein VP01_11g2 [Puccinia sorghi]